MSEPWESDFWTMHAIREARNTYGDNVRPKYKALHKFGGNAEVGTSRATLMTLPSGVLHETYLSANSITHISSAHADDDVVIGIEGHTINSQGHLTFVVQNATLNGQTKVAISTPLARCSRLYNKGSSDLNGDVYAFEDDTLSSGVPTTDAKVHAICVAAENQSLKAATSFSNSDYFFLTSVRGSIEEKTASQGTLILQIRNLNGVFRTQFRKGMNTTGAGFLITKFRPFIVIPKNTDVRMVADADGANTSISGGFDGIICEVL